MRDMQNVFEKLIGERVKMRWLMTLLAVACLIMWPCRIANAKDTTRPNIQQSARPPAAWRQANYASRPN